MPSILALIFITIFVLFLLRLDRKQYPGATLSLWLPTIWLCIVTGKPLGTWFATGAKVMEEGSAIDRNFLILLFCLGLIIIKKRNLNIIDVFRQHISVFLLIGFMFISIAWSDMPFISFKRWFRNLIPIVLSLIIASESDPQQALQCFFRRIIYIQIPFSYLLINYYPNLGRQYGRWSGRLTWIGVCTQKNGLASLCMFALFYFFWTFIRKRKGYDNYVVKYHKYLDIFICLLSCYLFLGPYRSLTYSATAMASLAIAIMSFLGLLLLRKFNISISANALTFPIIALIIYGTFTPFLGGLTIIDPSAILNRSSDLTGRNRVWEDLIPYAMKKPILGHGFGGFWTEAIRESVYVYPAHNGYLETILDIGFVGLVFLSIFLIANCRNAIKLMKSDYEWGSFWFSILLVAVSRNISESSVMSLTEFFPAVLFFIMTSHSLNISSQTLKE